MFIAIAAYKGSLVDTLQNGATIKRMYVDVRQQNTMMFTLICPGQKKVQQCSDKDKNIIFHNDVPLKIYFAICAWMEREFECNVYSGITLPQYSFTDHAK
jgi:hypothetical protein